MELLGWTLHCTNSCQVVCLWSLLFFLAQFAAKSGKSVIQSLDFLLNCKEDRSRIATTMAPTMDILFPKAACLRSGNLSPTAFEHPGMMSRYVFGLSEFHEKVDCGDDSDSDSKPSEATAEMKPGDDK